MEASDLATPSNLLRRLTIPVGLGVAALVVLAWYVTWTSSDFANALMAPAAFGSTDLALFFALIVVMMVAMMLPSALPMAVAYHGLTRLENGQPSKPADVVGTVAFVVPYFVVWGSFGFVALLVLFISGSMSLLWMGGISVAIFAEKLGVRTVLFSRAIGVILLGLGAVAAVRIFVPM